MYNIKRKTKCLKIRYHMQLSSSWSHRFWNMEKCAIPIELGFANNCQVYVQGLYEMSKSIKKKNKI